MFRHRFVGLRHKRFVLVRRLLGISIMVFIVTLVVGGGFAFTSREPITFAGTAIVMYQPEGLLLGAGGGAVDCECICCECYEDYCECECICGDLPVERCCEDYLYCEDCLPYDNYADNQNGESGDDYDTDIYDEGYNYDETYNYNDEGYVYDEQGGNNNEPGETEDNTPEPEEDVPPQEDETNGDSSSSEDETSTSEDAAETPAEIAATDFEQICQHNNNSCMQLYYK